MKNSRQVLACAVKNGKNCRVKKINNFFKKKRWVFSPSRVLSAVMAWPLLNVDTGNIQSEGHKGGLSFSLTASH